MEVEKIFFFNSLYNHTSPALGLDPLPKGHEYYKFGRMLHGHYNNDFFSQMCGSIEEIFK